ncbi:secretin N-terminal domain-containing protein [Alkalimarinus alittae]|uniref:Secretin n=1 Tax=Alkalimarinus alittae TaxID=2961619 RepID=A0ABY6N3Z2_9ALTE|nr:secretin N-terminal domain-containing protein [Alkalimarinus alittae]UZE96694.1 hypothetical protein NKI27_02770 [Alkalimarinus alittae]
MRFSWVLTPSLAAIKISILFLLLSVSQAVFAQNIEVISVQYRAAEDIASQIKALYPEQQVRVVGRGQQLTIRADGSTLEEIKQLVTSLDVAPNQFLISVSSDANAQQNNKGISGSISTSTNTMNNGSINIQAHKKSYKTRGTGSQAVRVLEGHSAFVSAGQKHPVRERQLINGQWVNGVDYIDMTSGFYIEPRLMGSDQVELKIRTQQNQASKRQPNTINTATIESVQVVRLGEWATIGGTRQDSQRSTSGIGYSTERHSIDNQSMTIKVDLVGD